MINRKNDASTLIFNIIVYSACILIFLIIVYPLYFIVLASISNSSYVSQGKVIFFPRDVTFYGYQALLKDTKVWIGYRNTIFYTVFGTMFNLVVTLPGAYAVSRKDFVPRRFIMLAFVFTMYFNGGLIPTYLLIKKLRLDNTALMFIIPFAVNVYNFIIARSFFESLPNEMYESASIDGCSNIRYFISIVLPISKAIISVIGLYYAVAHWNDFFTGLVYIRNNKLFPLQLVLREMLIIADATQLQSTGGGYSEAARYATTIKYSVIIVSTLPILVLYPFIQKYFEKGVMIGAIKG